MLIIGKSSCVNCSDLRAGLNKKGIPYTYLDQAHTHVDILDCCVHSGCCCYPFV